MLAVRRVRSGYVAFALFQMGRLDEAQAAIELALATARAVGTRRAWRTVSTCRRPSSGFAAMFARRANSTRKALAAFKALGNESGTAEVLGNLAELEFADGHPEQALRAVSEALEIHVRGRTQRTSPTSTPTSLRTASRLAISPAPATRRARDCALRDRHDTNYSSPMRCSILRCSPALGGDPRRGAQLLGYVDAQYTALGMQREPTEQWGYDKLMTALRKTLSEDEIAAVRSKRRDVVRRSGRRRSADRKIRQFSLGWPGVALLSRSSRPVPTSSDGP